MTWITRSPRRAIKSKAADLGFDLCGIAPADSFPELAFLDEWLARGYAGDMTYMSRSAERRADVRNVVPGARSVIVTGTLYNTGSDSGDDPTHLRRAALPRPVTPESDPAAVIARYAWGDDYHDVLKARLDALLAWMRAESPEAFDARAYVDTGPVQERVYAQYAGLGWIGKNTCLINAELGSWLFLAEIICTLPLEPDTQGLEQCGTCRRCLDACPTGALVEPGVLDSTRCLSYLTIELRTGIPEEHRAGARQSRLRLRHLPGRLSVQPALVFVERRRVAAARGLDLPRLVDLWRRSDSDLRTLREGQRDDARQADRPAAQPRRGDRQQRRRRGACRARGAPRRPAVGRRSDGRRACRVGATRARDSARRRA